MSLLAGFRAVQIGRGRAAAVCGRLFCDVGATVATIDASASTPLERYLDHSKSTAVGDAARSGAISAADRIVSEGTPGELRAQGHDATGLRRLNGGAAIVFISSFGQTGPRAEEKATDLTLFCASGIARLLTGQVDDLAEPPVRPVGEQSAMIAGIAAACAGMQAVLSPASGATLDVSIQEALATLAAGELARGGLTGRVWSRKRLRDGNGATVTILPAKDGYVAISPREERQWSAWLGAMGAPAWAVKHVSPARPTGSKTGMPCMRCCRSGVAATTSSGSPTGRSWPMCRAFRYANWRSSSPRRSSSYTRKLVTR